MNIYRCISEELLDKIPLLDDGSGPYEPYGITELVAADTPGQAKWAAWQTDKSYPGPICDMPKFSVVMTRKDVSLPRGVITSPKSAWWSSRKELCQMWRSRIAARRERRLEEAL